MAIHYFQRLYVAVINLHIILYMGVDFHRTYD